MFGIRSDGRRLKGADPIVMVTPYIMPTRVDAQNFCTLMLDYDPLVRYIKEKRLQGHNMTFMTIILAAYVRVVSQCPELNRFVSNKQIFARNRISVSFVVIKGGENGEGSEESVVKVEFDPGDTIFKVEEKIRQAIALGRGEGKDTPLANRLASVMLSIPGLATLVVTLARILDRYGLLPGFLYDASPFHTSLFISNMASLNMGSIYHHLYNFGTTSVFVALGKVERSLQPLPGGKTGYKNQLPLGVTTDERIMGGANYARCFEVMREFFKNPALLETPPEMIRTETKMRPARPVR